MKDFLSHHKHGIVTSVTIVLLVGFSWQVMSYLYSLKQQPEKRPPQIPPRSVLCRKVEYASIKSPITADGRVVSTRDVALSSEVRGMMIEGDVPFKKGQNFRRGQTLVRIFDDNAINNLRSRKSSFLQKIAGILPDLKVDYPDSFDRWNSFFQSVNIDDKLPDLPETSSTQEKIFVASRNILTDYFSIKSDEITLDKYIVRAPFNGTITEVKMEIGSIASPGATLANIIRTSSLEVEATVKAEDAHWVRIGDETTLSSESGEENWKGTVVRKAAFVDESTQSMSIFVRLKNDQEHPVYPGQYMRATFPGKVIENAMEIPRNSVFNHNEVFTVKDSKLFKKEIDIRKINETTLIFSGLEPGAELVVEPLINTMENTRVEIMR